ncbi:MAG: addiction module protein [Candidatus Scalindua sp.]|nr:addiction module protein [Candidatus Scalindua sp.]
MNVDKQLITSALELKPQDRFYLIELLVRSLDKPDPEIDEIWLKEAEARLDAFRNGKTEGVPAEDVIGETI